MTILQILRGEKVAVLQVNVLKEINSTQFVVGDTTGLAVMTVDESATRFIEVGKGVRMFKPSKVDEKVISVHPKFSPMKTKAMQMEVNYDEVEKFEATRTKRSPADTGIKLSQIESDYGETAVIPKVLVYVTSTSRKIDGKFGSYQICNIVDCDGSKAALNLYKSYIDKLETNKIYYLEKIKKTTIKSADDKLRMATTNFTKITAGSKSEAEIFADVKIADEKVEGICQMFVDLDLYRCCKKHLSKLDDDGCCPHCGKVENDMIEADFRCSLVITNGDEDTDTETKILIFKRHINIEISVKDDEDKLIEVLEKLLVGKKCKVDYNRNGDDNNIAVKVMITK